MTKGPRLRRTWCALEAHQQHVTDDERVHRSVPRPVIVQLAELELSKETKTKVSFRSVDNQSKNSQNARETAPGRGAPR